MRQIRWYAKQNFKAAYAWAHSYIYDASWTIYLHFDAIEKTDITFQGGCDISNKSLTVGHGRLIMLSSSL